MYHNTKWIMKLYNMLIPITCMLQAEYLIRPTFWGGLNKNECFSGWTLSFCYGFLVTCCHLISLGLFNSWVIFRTIQNHVLLIWIIKFDISWFKRLISGGNQTHVLRPKVYDLFPNHLAALERLDYHNSRFTYIWLDTSDFNLLSHQN